MKKIILSTAGTLLGVLILYFSWPALVAWFAPGRTSAPPASGAGHSNHAAGPSAPGERKILHWVDPMHPSYTSDRPGIAPDCGMKLVPVYADEAEKTAQMPPGTVRLTADRQQLIGVKLGKAEMRSIKRTIRATARIAYDETKITHFHNKVEGWIEKVYADYTGAPVRAGDPMFTLYSPELVSAQQEYLLALRARKELAESPVPEVGRSTEALVRASRDRLRLWDVTDEQIRRLEETGEPQRTLTFYSPHSGFLIEKKAFEHMRVTPETDLYTIANLNTVWALADIYEYEAQDVRVGQWATLTATAFPGRAFGGRINYIYPQLDPQTRTLRVRMEFLNSGLLLRPDMFATVEIEVSLGRQLVAPAEAVLDSGMQRYVFLAKGDGYFEPREVTLGPRSDGFYVVLSGLKPGDAIVASANFLIDSESRLKQAASQMSGHQP